MTEIFEPVVQKIIAMLAEQEEAVRAATGMRVKVCTVLLYNGYS